MLPAQAGAIDLFQFEKSYAAVGTPSVLGAPGYYAAQAEPALLAEAQFLGKFPLYRRMIATELRDGEGKGFNLYLTTQFRLRGLAVQSGPVRSPSFMPRFVGQYLWAWRPDAADDATRRVASVFGVIGHHSNGGDGCVFADETANANGDCVSSLPAGTPASQRQVKVRNGNFSTNYLEAGAAFRWARVPDHPRHHWKWAIDLSPAIQVHQNLVGFPLPGGPVPAFRDLYGPLRPRADVSGHYLIGTKLALRSWASVEFYFPREERFSGSRDYRLQWEVLAQLPANEFNAWWQRGLAIIAPGVRYVRGQDYYNTQFVRDISAWQFVLAVDPWNVWFDY